MVEKLTNSGFRVWFLVFFLVALDQISKIIARVRFQETREVIPDFFSLRFVENPGIAFSIPVPRAFLLIFVAGICAWIAFFPLRSRSTKIERSAFAFILSGALGNLIDRVFLGAVSDFLSFFGGRFPTFNFADIFVFSGVCFLIFPSFFQKNSDRR